MTATDPAAAQRRAALAAFYSSHEQRLVRAVHTGARFVGDAVIADACGYAWLQLVRRSDVTLDRHGFRWLTLVATQEAWRLGSREHEVPAGAFLRAPEDEHELREPAGPAGDPLERVLAAEAHRERVERFAALRPLERRELLLLAAGYRYREIAALTGSTYTAVDRHLREGRARLRPAG